MALPNLSQLTREIGQYGDKPFEDFIAALLVREHAGARQTNAGGGGDGGIDIQLDRDDGIVVWQVKNFAQPLNASQMAQVRNSITRLREHVEAEGQVLAEYNLVTVWTPTDQRLRSFTVATKQLGCPSHWRGAAYIHGLVSSHSAIYDRLIHGERHLERLVSERAQLSGFAPRDPGLPGFVDAVVQAQRGLKELEDFNTDPFTLSTTHIRVAEGPAILNLVGELDGVMHRVELLENGVWEVQSAIPNPSSNESPKISIHTRVAKADIEEDRGARDWLYWGVGPTEFDAEISIDGGPFATADWEPVRAEYFAASEVGASAPGLVMHVLGGSGRVRDVLQFRPVEVTRGVIGLGRRVLARSPSGAVEVEFRMGSTEAPGHVRLEVDLAGGHRTCDLVRELDLLARIDSDTQVEFYVQDQILACVDDLAQGGDLDAPLRVAQLFCEWSTIAGGVFAMPRMSCLNAETLEELERLGRVLRGERVEEGWSSLSLTVNDPDLAAHAFGDKDDGLLVYAATCDLSIGDQRYSIPRVITQAYSGFAPPTSGALKTLEKGDVLRLEPRRDPKVVWGILVDNNGQPLHPRDWKP